MFLKSFTVFLSVVIFSKTCLSVPLDFFFPFGNSTNDTKLSKNDDEYIELTLDHEFVFYNRSHTTLFVNNNGALSFNDALSTFTPQMFPLNNTVPIVAPFWADVDTRGVGDVWYRETLDQGIVMIVRRIVADAFPSLPLFTATELVFIATWDRVGYFNTKTDKTNTFQCILASDGSRSYVMFLYADDGIEWTTGDHVQSGGVNGTGGIPAQAGFDAGNEKDFLLIEGSFTNDIINIEEKSNVDQPGLFVFQVNAAEVQQAEEEPCPVVGSEACKERMFLAACRYLQSKSNVEDVPLPCQ